MAADGRPVEAEETAPNGRILVVDDEEGIRHIVRFTLRDEGFAVFEAANGEEALGVVEEVCPDLIVLDVMMPGIDGYTVMERLRSSNLHRGLPVIMLSALTEDDQVWKGWRSGVDWYLTKPFDPNDLAAAVHRLLGTTPPPRDEQPVARAQGFLVAGQGTAPQEGDPVVDCLLACIRAHSPSRAARSERVARLAFDLGRSLEWVLATPPAPHWMVLFDIGYLGVPADILGAPQSLTSEEMEVVRGHSMMGARILSHHPDFSRAAEVAATHHERFDGTGYPFGLAGVEIPLLGRVMAVADAFDAMTHDRPFRAAKTSAEAVAELRKGAGTQFDPDVIEMLTRADEAP